MNIHEGYCSIQTGLSLLGAIRIDGNSPKLMRIDRNQRKKGRMCALKANETDKNKTEFN